MKLSLNASSRMLPRFAPLMLGLAMLGAGCAQQKAPARELDTQALEQILIGHMMAVCGEANQIFRPVTMFDYGIDGEVEFKDNDGQASGKKIYVQLKSGNS
ncbi:MAG TPA: DUF4365 domain-containing protein, partial [Archangium sp.]|nr:DUF4365 domain-containing protein [Archangium sp.]